MYSLDDISHMVDGDEGQINELNRMFLSLAPQMMEDVKEHHLAGNYEKLSAAAHKFKSSIKLWKINDALELVLDIELLSKNRENLESLPKLIDRLDVIMSKVIRQMRSDLNL